MFGFYRTRWNAVLIIFLGITLSIVNFQHLLIEETMLSSITGSILPLSITTSVVAIGMWIWWHDWEANAVTRLAVWLVVGLTWMLIVGTGNLLYRSAGGSVPAHQWYLLGTFTSYGSIPALLTGWIDIQRLARERSLRQFKQTVESSKDLLAAVDTELNVVFANEAYRQYHGIESADITGRALRNVIGEDQFATVEPLVNKAFTGDRVQTELARRHPERGERILDVRLFPLEDNGSIVGVAASMRDVTDDRDRERQLHIMDRVLRHNVKNNMNVVKGYAEMLQKETGGDSEEHAAKIVSTSETLLDIANQQRKIMDFLSDPPQQETVDLKDTLERVRNRVQSDYPHANISMKCPAKSCRANVAIEDAFEELLTNAITHSEADHPRVTIGGTIRNGDVTIVVTDTNQAMSEMDRKILTGVNEMDPLQHGSGLGLWYVKLIVDHSNGWVEYDENEPNGNIVRVNLPLGQAV